jgi:hypothetical protein
MTEHGHGGVRVCVISSMEAQGVCSAASGDGLGVK